MVSIQMHNTVNNICSHDSHISNKQNTEYFWNLPTLCTTSTRSADNHQLFKRIKINSKGLVSNIYIIYLPNIIYGTFIYKYNE